MNECVGVRQLSNVHGEFVKFFINKLEYIFNLSRLDQSVNHFTADVK